MSKDSALAVAQALQKRSEERAKLTEETVCNAFLNQEKAINEDLNKSTESIKSAIGDRNEELIQSLNSRNGELFQSLSSRNSELLSSQREMIEEFNANNTTARNLLFKSWTVTLIGLAFLLLLGYGALSYQAKMIRDNWSEIAAQNQQKQGLEHYKVEAGKDENGLYLVLPKKAVITKTYISDSGYPVVRWGE